MARMIPPIVAAGTPVSERRAFDALKDASNSSTWSVLHSLGISSGWAGEYAEIDFVVIVPRFGIVCLEVKGGAVAHEAGIWTTRRHGSQVSEPLKRSPFRQAQEGMWKLRKAIERRFGNGSAESRCPFGWLVVFPDIDCPPLTPEFTRDEVIDRRDLDADMGERIRRVPSILRLAGRQDLVVPDFVTSTRLLGFLRPDFERIEMPSTGLWDDERRINALTEEQYAVLDAIADNPICIVKGPAGTGKTSLAVESARRAAAEGKKVLLTCYNRNLGQWLRAGVGRYGSLIVPGHIHGLLKDLIGKSQYARALPPHDEVGAETLYGDLYFELGALSVHDLGERFDVVIVDEAQDMDASRLADLVHAWADGVDRPRTILFGDFTRQAIYGKAAAGLDRFLAAFPGIPVFGLTVNCRNTRRIAIQTDLMCGFTGGRVSDRQPLGEPVELFFVDRTAMVPCLERIVKRLRQEGSRAEDAIVLGARRRENSVLSGVSAIGGWRLRDLAAAGPADLAYATIHSFKGLERPVVVLIEAGGRDPEESDSLLYVGMTRARLRLFVVADEAARAGLEKRMTETINVRRGCA